MDSGLQQQQFSVFRKRFPVFVYESFTVKQQDGFLHLQFTFSQGDKYFFRPQMQLPLMQGIPAGFSNALLQSLAFHIGMVEMISYWKAFCSPRILVKPFRLNTQQQQWWKKLFRYGLGEFFYTNGIEIPGDEIFTFEFDDHGRELQKVETPRLQQKVLIPVGGGKDSVVSLELLKKVAADNMAMVVNHRGATRDVLDVAGFDNNRVLDVKRTIDPLLLQLNSEGFLNGHTPFSALLAFTTALAACLSGVRYIALSNESSANEASIPGTKINHQYSKSLEFEEDFRSYFSQHIFKGLEYFSFLRPLNELQIGGLFSRFKKYHPVFKSCNAGSKTDSWCGVCSKCLFTFVILSPFLDQKAMMEIFGKDLFDDIGLAPLLDQLNGTTEEKPFECVGTVDEVNVALVHTIKRLESQGEDLPLLLKHYRQGERFEKYRDQQISQWLQAFHQPNFLEPLFDDLLRQALKNLNND
jgi:UDP-N-acetyl-alpha-D-muramoyl-L-alanyl-L-glutamate epimerase